MKLIYTAADLQEAYLLKGLLEHAGISIQLVNEHAQGAVGEIPFVEVFPELWVENDASEMVATQCVDEYCKRRKIVGESRCLKCGEMNPAAFDLCWQCGNDLGAL